MPVEILKPHGKHLDCCSAPGGKTTQAAQEMKNKGIIFALEKKKHRIEGLRNNLERMGVSNTVVYEMNAVRCGSLGQEFDTILVDAPCSGNYAGDAGWFDKRNMQGITENTHVQKEILLRAYESLKTGGRLVYSTCSLEPEENEMIIDWILRKTNAKLKEIKLDIGDRGLVEVFGQKLNNEIKKCRRFWPFKTGTEGFFIALLEKQ